MNKTPIYIALGIAAAPAFAQGVDKSAENYKEGKFSDYLTLIDKHIESVLNEEVADKDEAKNQLYNLLGLTTIESYEQSSTPDNGEWLNKIQLKTNGKSSGLISALSSDKHKGLVVPKMAPASSDLALQLTLNLTEIEPYLTKFMESSGSQEDFDSYKKALSGQNPMLGITTSDLLKKLDMRLNLVIDLDAENKLQTPFGAFDRPHLTGRIDGISWIWDKVGAMAIGGTGLPFSTTENGAVTTYSLPPEMAAQFMGFSPVISVDKESDQIWLSSTPEFLTKCSSGTDTLADSATFKAAFKGLPADGNSMTYASKDFYNFFGKSIMGVLEQNGLLDAADEVTKAQINKAKEQIDLVKTGTAQVISTDANGLLLSERAVQNIEEKMADLVESLDSAKKQLEEAKSDEAAETSSAQ